MAVTINASTSAGLVQTADTSGVLQLQTNSGTTAVTIDTSQNVGIGTTSPAAKLQVSSGNLRLSDGYQLEFGGSTNSIAGANASNYLLFYTNNTERMRIDSSGVVLVGTSSYNTSVSATCKFQVQNNGGDWAGAFQNNSSGTTYGLYVRYLNSAPNNSGSEFLYCNDSGALRATIRSNGGLANYQANNANLSDIREKTNIELAGSYLDKICAIPVKTFLFNDQTDADLNLGVIAQDVQAVAPELVSESNWAGKDEPEKLRLSIYQTDLQYALMKCIQEQQTIINDLKARITALEGAA